MLATKMLFKCKYSSPPLGSATYPCPFCALPRTRFHDLKTCYTANYLTLQVEYPYATILSIPTSPDTISASHAKHTDDLRLILIPITANYLTHICPRIGVTN